MKRKLTILIVALLFVCSLTGCSGSKKDIAKKTSTSVYTRISDSSAKATFNTSTKKVTLTNLKECGLDFSTKTAVSYNGTVGRGNTVTFSYTPKEAAFYNTKITAKLTFDSKDDTFDVEFY